MTDEQTAKRGNVAGQEAAVSHRKLRDIFVATTDAEEFTETQNEHTTRRTATSEESVSAIVTDIARADGLADTYGGLVYDGESR